MRVIITIPVGDDGIAMSEAADIVHEVARELPVRIDDGTVEVNGLVASWRIDDDED